MKFKLKKLDTPNKRQFAPYSQIIEHIYCDKCDTRETSNMSVGFTLLGLQFFCDNCEKSVLHIALNPGEYEADPFSHGKFNKRNLKEGEDRMNKYSINTIDLLKKKQEEEEDDFGYDHKIRHNAIYSR
tara:strand:- start:283 stop:666 length:384 start_codon:yes stop_codon:yes gene_type:complete